MNTEQKIIGPVIPLPTPFTEELEVDYNSMEQYVKFLVNHGIRNVMTTVGTSRFNLLTESEIKKLNESVVSAAGSNCLSIVANPPFGSTSKAIEFAKHSESINADYFLLYYPERYYGEENTLKFFKTVADACKIKILIHEMPVRNGFGPGNIPYSIDLLEKLLSIPNVVGFKEEALDAEHSNKILSAFKGRAEIIGAGGGMSRFLNRDHTLGSKAFLGGIGNFIPEMELEFYSSIMNGDHVLAASIVNEIEIPYFEKVVPLGWHPSLKAALALKNLMPGYERPPMKQMTEKENELLRSVFQKNNWL